MCVCVWVCVTCEACVCGVWVVCVCVWVCVTCEACVCGVWCEGGVCVCVGVCGVCVCVGTNLLTAKQPDSIYYIANVLYQHYITH